MYKAAMERSLKAKQGIQETLQFFLEGAVRETGLLKEENRDQLMETVKKRIISHNSKLGRNPDEFYYMISTIDQRMKNVNLDGLEKQLLDSIKQICFFTSGSIQTFRELSAELAIKSNASITKEEVEEFLYTEKLALHELGSLTSYTENEGFKILEKNGDNDLPLIRGFYEAKKVNYDKMIKQAEENGDQKAREEAEKFLVDAKEEYCRHSDSAIAREAAAQIILEQAVERLRETRRELEQALAESPEQSERGSDVRETDVPVR